MPKDNSWVQGLLTADAPLEVIWGEMLALWQTDSFPTDLVAFYNRREEAFNRLEEWLYCGYFEVYDLLLEHASRQDGGYVRDRLSGNTLVVIADSLSVRETGLLSLWLGEQGWEVSVEGFAVAPFPTTTESLSEKLLGAGPSGGRDSAAFAYRYVTGPEQMPALPADRPTLVWLRLPDTVLEEITVAQAATTADAFERTALTLKRLLEAAGQRPIYVTSDHGYLYAQSPAHYWMLPTEVEPLVRRVFPRESRSQFLDQEPARSLQHYESRMPENRLFAFSGSHVGLRGRYWWARQSPNDRCTAHGGLSLAESMVPVLAVRQRRLSGLSG
jgi:hypothetical protein